MRGSGFCLDWRPSLFLCLNRARVTLSQASGLLRLAEVQYQSGRGVRAVISLHGPDERKFFTRIETRSRLDAGRQPKPTSFAEDRDPAELITVGDRFEGGDLCRHSPAAVLGFGAWQRSLPKERI